MGNILKRMKKREHLTEEEVINIKKEILELKDEAELICKNKQIDERNFKRLIEIGKTLKVYENKLKNSLKYSGGN